MGRVPLEQAYPRIAFRPRSRNWWARLTRVPPECVHLDSDPAARDWMALLAPDTVYLRGRPAERRHPARPEVSVCRPCLLEVLRSELYRYDGRVVAFEPDAESFSQYFFVAPDDFTPAGLKAEVGAAIEERLLALSGSCEECSRAAMWLWLSRADVSDLDDTAAMSSAAGRRLCALHGGEALCATFERIHEANLFFVNEPYGDSGAYLWI